MQLGYARDSVREGNPPLMKPTETIYWIFIRPTFFEEPVLFLFHLFSLHLFFLQPFLPDCLYLELLFLPRCKPLGQGI